MKQFKVKHTWWEWQLCTLIWTHQLSTFCWLEAYPKVIGVLGTHIDWYLPKRSSCMYLQICAPNSVQFHSIQMLFNWQRVAKFLQQALVKNVTSVLHTNLWLSLLPHKILDNARNKQFPSPRMASIPLLYVNKYCTPFIQISVSAIVDNNIHT